MSSKREGIPAIVAAAEEAGCVVVLSKNGHYKIKCPSGQLVVAASTASDRRAPKNLRAMLRRNGVDV